MEKKERPQERFDRLNSKVYRLKVMTRTEQDIIAKLDGVPNKSGYIKGLIRADVKKQEEEKMARISIDNGTTYISPAEALESVTLDQLVEYMDDETREAVHAELAPCTDEEFLRRYLEIAADDLIIG